MSYQYWYNQGKVEKSKFISFNNGYHGDTFGAMSVAKQSGFYKPFEKFMFDVKFFDFPETWYDDKTVEEKERKVLNSIREYLEKESSNVASVIIEPLVQGAGGMKICRKEFLTKLINIAHEFDVLVIFDEVMTGFGRTGDYFVCSDKEIKPDIIALSKGITGGFMALAATIATEEIYSKFYDNDFSKAFVHGHSYTANPIACAAGVASLEIFKQEKTIDKIKNINTIHKKYIDIIASFKNIEKTRIQGSIAAFNIKDDIDGYSSKKGKELSTKLLKEGIILRPLGNVVYLLPPYCINNEELEFSYQKIIELL